MKKLNVFLAAALCVASTPAFADVTQKISSIEVYFECQGTTPVLTNAINALVNVGNHQYKLPDGILSVSGKEVFMESNLGHVEIATLSEAVSCNKIDGIIHPSKNLLILAPQLELAFSLDENIASCHETIEQSKSYREEKYALISGSAGAPALINFSDSREFASPSACLMSDL